VRALARWSARLSFAVAAALLGGCGSSLATAPTVPRPSTTAGPPTATSTTALAGSCPAVSGYQALPGGRTMLVRAPASDHQRSAVIMLHGYTATPEGEEAVTGWTSMMAGTDVVVAYPEGSPTPNGGFGWTTGAAHYATTGTDDVADLNNAIDALIGRDCVAPGQIMVTGESNGSGMGLVAACNPPTAARVRLFALAIPAVDPNVTAQCTNAEPFPFLVIASLLDQVVPYDGSSPPGVPPFSAPLAWFGQIATTVNGCSGAMTTVVPDGMHTSYAHCAAAANFYVANDGQHTWPGGPAGAGGLAPGLFAAARLAWCASGLPAAPAPVADCASVLSTYGLSATGPTGTR
jgi:poly(3-hydroxybutyrate) depolymerase